MESPEETERYASELLEDPELRELVLEFCRKIPDRLAELKAAIDERDLREIARVSHKLKGTFAGYGLSKLSGMVAQLEDAALKGSDAPRLSSMYAELSAAGKSESWCSRGNN